MFPLTHVLLAQDILNSQHFKVVLGSMFPDLGNIIGVDRHITHEMGTGFFGFCRNHHPEFLDFALAIITHGTQPWGVDYYADESYQGQSKGYCFQRAVPIVHRVIEACKIPEEMGLWKAHNFIEMVYDLIAVGKYPFLTGVVEKTLNDIATIEDCAETLGKYFNMDISLISKALHKMPDFFCLTDVNPGHLAEKYAYQLKVRHGITSLDIRAMSEIITDTYELINPEFNHFYNFCREEVSSVLKKYR